MKSVWVICNSISVTDWACLPSTNLLNVVLRCWSPPGRVEDTFGVFWRISDTVWRTPVNMWPEMLNLQDQNVPWPLPASCHSPFTSPLMIKLCSYTFKCRMLQWFKITLPLACALDLAALENIPSLSFRNVYRYQPGEKKLFSVLILIPRCLHLRSVAFMWSYVIWKAKLILDTFVLTKVCPSLIQIQSDL